MKKKLIAIATAAVAIVPLTGSPASATVSGEVAFECTASLPSFPSSSGQGSCKGSATVGSGSAGAMAGVSNSGQAYAVATGPNVVNNFSATFDYQEPCIANEPPAVGTAQGSATITGLTGVKNGIQVTATATVEFTWTRGGATAAIVISGGSVVFSDGDSATVTAGVATAAFVPLLQANNTCPSGGPLTAVVTGEATIGA